MNPLKLLTHNTFDVPAKVIMAREIINPTGSRWPLEIYQEHLRVWNGIYEHEPRKTSAEDYIKAFSNIIAHMQHGTFDWNKSPILTCNGKVINGRHRLSAAIALGLNEVVIKEAHFSAGQEVCDWDYLRTKKDKVPSGLHGHYGLAMALEYCRLKENTRIACVFRPHDRQQMINTLSKAGSVFFKVGFPLVRHGPYNLMRELYYKEPWVLGHPFPGATEKANLCFPKDGGIITIYCIDVTNPDIIREVKQAARQPIGGQHAMHINDTHEETMRIARTLLSFNGINYLNNAKLLPAGSPWWSMLKEWESLPHPEDFAIDGSGVLAAYGLREARDLDYLAIREHTFKDSRIHNHASELKYYGNSVQNLVTDPRNFFWFNNIKYIALDVVKKMKETRGEEKDKIDIQLIQSL